MNDIVKRMVHLITGYLKGSLDPSELQELEQWTRESEDNRQLFESLTDPANLRAALDRYGEKRQLMLDRIKDSIAINRIHRSAWWYVWGRCIAVAAVVSLLFIVAWYFMNKNTLRYTASRMPDSYGNDVQPGNDQSRLTLSDGSVLILIDSINGVLTTDASSKAQVFKEHGWLSYHDNMPGDSLYFNTLEVPRKGQHKVLLPDGSRVWLNAGSSLRYPVAFGTSGRRVKLQGEAYFEVTSRPQNVVAPTTSRHTVSNAPFIVDLSTANGSMQLVTAGARFNVQAYPGKPNTYITLLEGDLKLNREHQVLALQPRQQARLEHNGQIAILNQANPTDAIAWKEVNQ
ncbi:MAG: FecR domain-containing protein [Niastella sp.]|nr:FecR domain-containing protein [Niastella sp.]